MQHLQYLPVQYLLYRLQDHLHTRSRLRSYPRLAEVSLNSMMDQECQLRVRLACRRCSTRDCLLICLRQLPSFLSSENCTPLLTLRVSSVVCVSLLRTHLSDHPSGSLRGVHLLSTLLLPLSLSLLAAESPRPRLARSRPPGPRRCAVSSRPA